MNSLRTSNTNRSFKQKLLIVGVLFVLSVISWIFLPSPVRSLTERIFNPLLKVESSIYNSLQGETEEENISILDELNYLRAENTELHAQLGDESESRVVAGVIGRPTALPYDVLVIDKGQDDGVFKDAPVFAGRDRAIGLVSESYQKSAVVTLITTPNITSTVYVYGPNIYTTAVGIGGGVFRIHVPQGVDIKEGDMVVTPALSGGIYGSITAIDSIPSKPEQYGYVTSDIPISSLRYVSVGSRSLSVIDFEEAKSIVEKVRTELLNVPVPAGVLIDVSTSTSTSTPTVDVASSTATEEATE